MKRRGFLASVGLGVSTGLAGCFGGGGGNQQQTATIGGGGGTPTGTPLPNDAQLSLERIEAPPQAEIQKEYTFTLHVRNSGGQPGVYRAPISVRRGTGVSYEQVNDALVYVEPGETQAAEISLPPFQYTGAANIRIGGPQNQWRVEIVGAELPFGATFTTPEGMRFSVQRIDLRDSYVYQGPGENRPVQAPQGSQYAFVYVRVTNNVGREDFTPNPQNFRVLYQGRTIRTALITRQTNRYRQRQIPSGATTSGWIPFEVPAEASLQDLEVKWTSGTGTRTQIVRWRRSLSTGRDGGQSTGGSTTTSSPQG